MISCILLTAGESLRFGSPKALANLGSTKVIKFLQQKLVQTLIDEIIIVTGAYEPLIKPHVFNHSRVRLVHNKDYKFGQTSSFQKGLSIVDKNSKAFMLLPVDCPFVCTNTINNLIACFQQHTPEILIPTYQGKRGHPPIFNSKLKKDIFNIPEGKGLNSIIDQRASQTLEINDPGLIQTFNTKNELNQLLKNEIYKDFTEDCSCRK